MQKRERSGNHKLYRKVKVSRLIINFIDNIQDFDICRIGPRSSHQALVNTYIFCIRIKNQNNLQVAR